MRTDSYGAARPLIGQQEIKQSRKWNRAFIVAAFLLLIGSAIAYFTINPMQSSAVGVNRQYAVEEFPEADIDNIDADYGMTSKRGGGGKKGGGKTKVKKTKAPKPAKQPKTKPTKAPKIKPSKTPKTTDPTTAAPVTPDPTTSWPTSKPTNRPTPRPTNKPTAKPTTGWPTSKPTNKPTPRPTNKPTEKPTTGWPTSKPTAKPTARPTPKPTYKVTPEPTAWQTPKPVNPPGMTCAEGAKGVLSTKGGLDDFIIGLDMDCDAERVTVSITKNAFKNTWFGIVFSDHMIGTSLIYTVGNPGAKEQDRYLALYQYNNMQKSSKKVKWDSSIEWTEELVKVTDDSIKIVYSAPIDGSPIDLFTKEVQIRAAFGPRDYHVEYHTFSGRTQEILTLNLVGEGEEAAVIEAEYVDENEYDFEMYPEYGYKRGGKRGGK